MKNNIGIEYLKFFVKLFKKKEELVTKEGEANG